MQIHIAMKLPSLTNLRLHWHAMSAMKKKQKETTRKALERIRIPPCPLVVTIVRIGPRKLDGDNLQSACKYVRDEIARAVGVDDGSDIYTWIYDQRIGPYGVIISFVTRES